MDIERLLTFPAVDQQDRFGIIERSEVFVSQVTLLRADPIRRTAFFISSANFRALASTPV